LDITRVLRDEHVLITEFNEMIERSVAHMHRGHPPRRFFELALRFAREFVWGYHHVKEEHHVFSLLSRKYKGFYCHSVERLRKDHEAMGADMATIASKLSRFGSGGRVERGFKEALTRYHRELKRHIFEEDIRFFPAVEQHLDDEDLAYLKRVFESEQRAVGPDFMDNQIQLLREMDELLARSLPQGGKDGAQRRRTLRRSDARDPGDRDGVPGHGHHRRGGADAAETEETGDAPP